MKFSSIIFRALAIGCAVAVDFSNPLREYDGGDPDIVYQGGYYYFMCWTAATTWTDLQMTRATTLEGLKDGERKQIYVDEDPSRCCNVWAPEMHFIDEAWHIYYAAGPEVLSDQRSHVLVGGANPWDEYTYLGQIRDDWSIDGTIVKVNDKNYYVYSCFAGPQGLQSNCIAEMLTPSTTGESVLLSSPTEQWELSETPVNEGPHALYHDEKVFISFSGSFCWTPDYALGLLTYDGSGDPMDPASWVKSGPHFQSANGEYGTGHNSFLTSPDGSEIWNVYHSTPEAGGNCGSVRYSNAKRVEWNEDGTPDFGQPLGYGVVQPGPSGE